MRDFGAKLKEVKNRIFRVWDRVRLFVSSSVKRVSENPDVSRAVTSVKKGWAVVSRKWKRACFVTSITLGIAVSRLSENRRISRVLSFLGIMVKRRKIRGEEVEMIDIDERRRTFLKYAFFGGTVLFAGRYINPLVNLIRGDTVLSEKTFENFKITETGRRLLVTDDDGGEILTIDKESF